MLDNEEGSKRKSTRTAAIKAAKRIKEINAEVNKSICFGEKQKYQFYEAKILTLSAAVAIGGKNNTTHHVFDSPFFLSEAEVMRGFSRNNQQSYEMNPSKCEDKPKRRRGRPPKEKSAKCPTPNNASTRYKNLSKRSEEEVDYDVNVRRQSYNCPLMNNETIENAMFSGLKQLQHVNRDVSYKESLMRFSKILGPTARKVARRMLHGQGLTYQARHRLEPLVPSPEPQPNPRFVNVSSINGSFRSTNLNQFSQPLMIKFGESSTHANNANYKGKNFMVDNGKNDGNIWGANDNLDFLFGKQLGGIKIGNGLSNNQNLVHKNLDYGLVGSQNNINHIGSFYSNNSTGNLNQNINMVTGTENGGKNEDFWNLSDQVTPRNEKPNSVVYPSTYVQPSRYVFSPVAGLNDGMSSSQRFSVPLNQSPQPMQLLQNWCLPPTETKSPVVNDDFWKEQEMQLASALNMQMADQEPNVWSQNVWAPNQPNQVLQLEPHGSDQLTPQDQFLTPMQPLMWSELAMLAANPEPELLPFGTPQDFGFQMGCQLYPPPGI